MRTDKQYIFSVIIAFNVQLPILETLHCMQYILIDCSAYLDISLQITQLKIDNNPFAKGFRDTGAGKREKK